MQIVIHFLQKKHILIKSFHCTKKNEISIKDLFSKCNQIRRKQQIWSHLLKKSLMENLIFCAVFYETDIIQIKKLGKSMEKKEYIQRNLADIHLTRQT